jgi:uncharacterized protein (TIGR02145 family)
MSNLPSRFKKGVIKSLTYILISTPILFNCTKVEFEDLEIIEPKIILSEKVNILSNSELENISEVDSLGNISFYDSQNYSTGEIIIAGMSDKTPGGLLKKIENISEDKKIIKTTNVPLDEVIKKGEFSYSKNIEIEKINGLKGINYDKNNFSYSFDEVLIDFDNDLTTIEDQIKVNGNVSFDITTDIEAKFNWGDIYFKFETNVNEISSLEAIANMNFVNFDKEVLVFTASGVPFEIPAPIPLIARPEFELYIGAKGRLNANAKTKLENNFEFNGEIYYQNKEWSSKNNFVNEFIFYEPVVSIKGELIAYCKPKLNLIIDEIVGPSAGVKGYLELNVDNEQNPWWEIYGGLDIILGLNSGWLTKNFGDYEKNILEFKEKVADSGGIDDLEAKLNADPSEGFLPVEVLFDASMSKGNIIKYNFNFGDGNFYSEIEGNENFDGKIYHIYENIGIYNPELTVEDVSGKTDSKSLEILVKEPLPPAAHFGITPNPGYEETIFNFDASVTSDDEDNFEDLFFRWDFEGDGIWETDFGKEFIIKHQYSNFGTYMPTLEVKDSRGLISKADNWLEVKENIQKTFIDSRDNQEYKIIKIGNDWWFAENCKFNAEYLQIDAFVYGDDWNNFEKHGLIYDYPDYKICPTDWHISSDEDWKNLEFNLGMDITEIDLRGWRGEGISNILQNQDEFNLTLSGYGLKYSDGRYFRDLNLKGVYWTNTNDITPEKIIRMIDKETNSIYRGNQNVTNNSFFKIYSIRCVKNP